MKNHESIFENTHDFPPLHGMYLWGTLLSFLIIGSVPSVSLGRAKQDPRLNDTAQQLEAADLTPLYQTYSCSSWTKSVLQGLSKKERMGLAKVLRKAKRREIREGHVEQYRASWRSNDRPDSDVIVSYYMDTLPSALNKPMIAFSSSVEKIPTLLADALEEGDMPLVASFYQPLSPWLESLPKMKPEEKKNRVLFYRSLKLVDNQKEERVYQGPYLTSNELRVQDELRIRLQLDGRWLVE